MYLIDTHAHVENLIKVGIEKEQAEAIVNMVKERDSNSKVATESDINILLSQITELITELKTEIIEVKTELRIKR